MNRSAWRSVIKLLLTPAFVVAGCSSTSPPPLVESNETPLVEVDHRAWEEATRRRVDDLMAEAERLTDTGRLGEALDRVDEALCEMLDLPPNYVFDTTYLDFLAKILEEADDLQAMLDEPLATEESATDLVLLPPLDVTVDDLDVAIEVAEGLLPPSDYPLELNSTVESFLDAMISEGEYRNRVETGLVRAGRYLPMIRSKFARAGLPEDLSFIPLIESSFSLTATSRARAHGMWQFMSSTGRHYGLEIGALVDERRDPVRATEAAVAYLQDLHKEFADWHLALAAYNSGAGNVRRAMRRSGSRDFWALRRFLPRETRNYVPAFIASVIIAKQPTKYGFPTPTETEWRYDTIEVPDALDLEVLATQTEIPITELRALNPAIRRDLTLARQTTLVRLPPGAKDQATAVLQSLPRHQWAPRMIHTVRKGDSLYTIARRYGSSVSALKQANGLRGSLIRPGQSLVVPRQGQHQAYSTRPPADRASVGGVYVVQKQDTLWDIARSFSVSVDSLCATNGLTRSSVIKPGQTLRVPSSATSPPPPPVATGPTYTVRRGDTLSDIAQRHGTTVESIRSVNGLNGSRIYPGNVLRIPAEPEPKTLVDRSSSSSTTYRVRKGDTLYDIARRFGVSVAALRRENGLSGSRIYPGEVLRIPRSQARG